MKNTLNFGQRGASGIYQIYNLVTGTYYIGSAFNLSKRYSSHKWLLAKNEHYNKKLQYSYNKYGGDNFEFRLLEFCEKGNVIEREQYYFDTLKPYYNCNPKAGNCAGRKLSVEHIQKIIAANTGLVRTEEQKRLISEKNKLQTRTEKQKSHLSAINKGKKLSEDTKKKISDYQKTVDRSNFLPHTTKLSRDQVIKIKDLISKKTCKEVAEELCISIGLIYEIKAKRTWKNV